ncbi:MAG TPA: hypothetical protein VIQ02_17550 [Jiangellaceae bacterium]
MQVVAGVCQLVYVVYFTITHWVPMSPFNDLRHEHKAVIAAMQVVLGILAIGTLLGYRWALWSAAVAYSLVFASHLLEWWIPYFTGRPAFALDRPKQNTATYLPARGNRPVPDYLHTGIGLLVLAALITSWLAVAGA